MQMLERAEEMAFFLPIWKQLLAFWKIRSRVQKWTLGRKDVTVDELLGKAILITE